MIELLNDAIYALADDHDRIHSAKRPTGRKLPRALSRILIGPAANVAIGIHTKPAAPEDYHRWTELLNTRGIDPIWLSKTTKSTAPQVHQAHLTDHGVTVTTGHHCYDLDELLLGIVTDALPRPSAGERSDTWPSYDSCNVIATKTGDTVEYPWCPVCQAPRPRVERSTHVINETLAENEGVVIDAELLTEIDTELQTQVFTGGAGSDHDIDTVLQRFIEYGWGIVDRDGDILRTDVAASEPTDEEMRQQARNQTP